GRMQFPSNMIPAGRLNPLALAAMAAMPLPNVGITSNFVNTTEVQQQNLGNYSLRLDYALSAKINLFGRYSISNEHDIIPDVVPNRDLLSDVRPQNAALGLS